MKLIEIDKARYRKHLNVVIVVCIVVFASSSLGLSQLLIALYPDPSGSHFHWNLTGVIVSAIAIGFTLNKYRTHPFMKEVTYVWELKQTLNKLTRKMRKLKEAAAKGDVNAMVAINYSYAGSRLLWELDDNTIIMDQLAIDQAELDRLAVKFNVRLDHNDYEETILNGF
ncbi:DUF3087 domain-containing protein [Glaciecola sp. KUL10]|uniref:DUF3087 domain-containing protein n=1 Tax=Glaciecola sp. (strain KUL10) TaxID=2161813 RepID=UPI000D78B645|nr:DUF3087 domain-containing protein [Glaciecola sp. KUL10]GBL05933.1 hypothetical protein KUL10_32660 [Glaciecola sp. KUL10]